MKFFGQTLKGFAAALVILVAIFLVSCGLCGFSLGVANGGLLNGSRGPLGAVLGVIAIASGIGIVLSVLGVAIVLVAWLISAMVGGRPRPSDDHVQKPFDSDRKEEDKDSR
jgi:hypothetical protein